ncbi:MAG: YbbR-like domain-containing protein [Paludibacter sp.]|nr:YbbR-like domain-containing protein [Paludibacter sp.]MDD4198796.1 YbbR-like domain-containing protein [Paludibacter sp.]MDD4427504.1 YbbR-like domain-containing protein [Paludibacter sp.]
MADYSKRKLLKFVLKLKAFFISKDVLSFLVFLLLSAAFWFINALNKERELSLTIPVVYSDVPQNLMFEEELPSEIRVKVKDLGVNLWTYLRKKPDPVHVEFKQTNTEKGHFSVSNLQLLSAASERLLPSTSILLINPENISTAYIKLYSKKLPVRLISEVSLENQYMLCSPLVFFPQEIEVYGPLVVLEKLTELHTEKLNITNLRDTVTRSVLIKPIQSVRFAVDKIAVKACAEMFTEKTVSLPVQIINNPENISVLSFPAEVKAVFNIGMKNFNSFQNSDIHVVIDFNEIKKGDFKKKKLKIINNKPYISNIRIQPEEIEFLLEER